MKISDMVRQGTTKREAKPTLETSKVGDDLWEAMTNDKAFFGLFDNPEKSINWKKIESVLAKSISKRVPHIQPAKSKQIASSYIKWMQDRIDSGMLSIYKDIKDLVQTQIPDRLGNA